MTTISSLAHRFGLSRSTLLHYDRIGLLKSAGRTAKAYRVYGPEDAARLEAICAFRRAGLGLKEIKALLDGRAEGPAVFEGRLRVLDQEIQRLRGQQRMLVGLLRNPGLLEGLQAMDKATWTSLLAASGFSEADMVRWHEAFERTAPDRHRRFLEFLGLEPLEVAAIRRRSRAR
jgi:DNA-binding transcriptional MerR regulator